MPFAVGDQVRCVNSGRNNARNEEIIAGLNYTISEVGETWYRLVGMRTMWSMHRFQLVVEVPVPAVNAPRRTMVRYILVDEREEVFTYRDQDTANRKRQLLIDRGVQVLACKKITLTLNN